MTRSVVLGGSGFIGSHVADALSEAGHDVTVFDHVESAWLRDGQRMVIGDLLDRAALDAAVAGQDIVLHFAGVSDIGDAEEDPASTAEANVVGTVHALGASADAGVRRFVFASSMYVYSHLGSFYRASKQSAEHFIDAYQTTRGLDFTVLRFGTLYGPRADDRNRIRDFVRQAVEQRCISYVGTGSEIREPIHVFDAARLTVLALDEAYRNKHLILTGQDDLTLSQIVDMIREMLPFEVAVERADAAHSDHFVMTPYSYRPVLAEKLTPPSSIDLGQGILDLIYELEKDRWAAGDPERP